MFNIIKAPDLIGITTESGAAVDTAVTTAIERGALSVDITAETDRPKYVKLRWSFEIAGSPRIMGDAWERSYGDLEWRGIAPERALPWYFLMKHEGGIFACGVKVQPSALCYFQVDRDGVTLTLDIRNGARGVELRARTLHAADVVCKNYEGISAYEAASDFCGIMADGKGILPEYPVYGSNNWYYAYGNSSRGDILEDTDFICEMTEGLENRPFMVIDDGWSVNRVCGPWKSNEKFGDMPTLIAEMKARGVHPGIWIRPLYDAEAPEAAKPYLRSQDYVLDPTNPAVLDYIAESVERIASWGCELVKYDFSANDISGTWGSVVRYSLIPEGANWGFCDPTVTTAEAAKTLYSRIHKAAGDMILIGCNCINHLCVGYVHLNRTGDDTSGMQWERTRCMGINTLAFRLAQNGRFFAVDADCAGVTAQVPWNLNSRWLDLLAKSGTPLFASCKKSDITPEMKVELKRAFARASVQSDSLIPLDWEDTICPTVWELNGEVITYKWSEPLGADYLI